MYFHAPDNLTKSLHIYMNLSSHGHSKLQNILFIEWAQIVDVIFFE